LAQINPTHKLSIQHARDNDFSVGLTVHLLPIVIYNFDLTAQELRDALALHYRNLFWPFLQVVMLEPIISEGPCDDTVLVADLGIRVVLSPQSEALFDIRNP